MIKRKTMHCVIVICLLPALILASGCANKTPAEEKETYSPTELASAAPEGETQSPVFKTAQPESSGEEPGSTQEPAETPEPAEALARTFFFRGSEKSYSTLDKSKEGERKTVTFAGKDYEVEYRDTWHMAIGNYEYDAYTILGGKSNDETDPDSIYLLPDGRVLKIHANIESNRRIVNPDLDGCVTNEQIRAKIESALKSEIDFGSFKKFEVLEFDSSTMKVFKWYNEKNGIYRADDVSIRLSGEGKVTSVVMNYRIDEGLELVPDDVSVEACLPAIEAKMNEVYKDSLIEYSVHFDGISRPVLTNILGDICVYFNISVTYTDRYGAETYARVYTAVKAG